MIEFRFDSLSDFLQMSGHGIYVWACVAIALVILTALLVYPVINARTQLTRIHRQQIMQKMQQERHQQANASAP
ncbi:heme exporter protein CcmD [Gilvimarinus agarilyticus]|uniref:heme exporter protein CcmD n=1 Tax=Gilvimarinus agarilyticus TaxID=679259 RepID=UPI000698DC5C|nr:heme exporter protein CcmD [Gilvimarinus agarilyticus]